jgi:hypothetical protein
MKGSVSALSAGAYTATLFVMVDIVKGGGRAVHPPPHLHQPGLFFHHDRMYARKQPSPLVCTLWFAPYLRKGQTVVLNQFTTDTTEIFKEQILNGIVLPFLTVYSIRTPSLSPLRQYPFSPRCKKSAILVYFFAQIRAPF